MAKQQTKKNEPAPDFRLVYQLAERYSEASQLLDEQAKGDAYGCSGSMILVDSFAVELYLKCLFVLDNGEKPAREHDWKKLFDGLKSHTKQLIRESFNSIIRDDPVLHHLKFINPDAPAGVTDFDASLTVAAGTFDQRRYLYENAGRQDWFYAHLVRNAIRNVTKLDLRLAFTSS